MKEVAGEKLIDFKEVAGRNCEVAGRNQLILLRKKKSILSEKENMGNQMQMVRVREGAVGVEQTELERVALFDSFHSESFNHIHSSINSGDIPIAQFAARHFAVI